MYQFRISKVAPFWARNNENKPNQTIFTNWLNTNMKRVDNLPIKFNNFTTFTINGNYNDVKYIEITNTADTNDVRYYYVDGISLDGGNNTYEYRGVIDVYTTFTLKFINDNINNEFVFLRQHNYDKKCLQIRDKYLDEIPKIYTSYYFKKSLFNKDANTNIWYGNSIGIKDNNDLINANKYYVFKDGVNGGYSFYPILSKSTNVDLCYQQRVKGSLKTELDYWNGKAGNEERVEISDEVNTAVVNAYQNNDWVEYLYHPVDGLGINFWDWKVIENVPYGTLPIDIKAESNQWNQAGVGIKQASFDIYLLGNNIYHLRTGNTLAWDHANQWNHCKEFRQLKVKVYDATTNWTTISVKNSITDLETLRKQPDNINKFVGIFYLPHFLNFDAQRLNFNGNYVYLNINPQTDNIGLFKIYEYQLSNITDKLNNPTYSTEYFLRYLNIKYYGNNINAEYRTNNQHNIFIGGRLFFTDTANIICKSNEYISLNNSIINYPYQLPIGVDTYEQYVKANRNVVETGFNVARKEQQLSFAKSIVGGVVDGVASATKIGTGNVIGGVAGAVSGAINLGFDIFNQFQGLDNQEAQIRAQYQQANNTMGNEIQFSNIETAALMEYYNDNTQEQYEGVEVCELEKNVLTLMNNYIYLNGYMLPNSSTFNNKINNNRVFNYIQLDATLLQNQLNIIYDDKKYNNDIYQMIKEQLIAGIRIWNKIDEKLPEYDDNVSWPDQPETDRPTLPQPKPPKNVRNINVSATGIKTYEGWSDNSIFIMYWTPVRNQPDKVEVSTAFSRANSLPLSNNTTYNHNTETIKYTIDFNNQTINQTAHPYTYLVQFNNNGDLNYSKDIVINLINMNQQDVDYIENTRPAVVSIFNSNRPFRAESNFKVYINGRLYGGK